MEEQVSQNTFTVCSFVGEMQGPKNGLYFVSTRFLIVFPSSLFMHKVTMFLGGLKESFDAYLCRVDFCEANSCEAESSEANHSEEDTCKMFFLFLSVTYS